jgi:hypothetical protein
MKRRAEFLVRKRDGRKEWLRATKLGRSIQLAAAAATAGDVIVEQWWAMELTAAVLQGLRKKRGGSAVLTTAVLAEAVEQVFVATGFPQAAEAYRQAGADQRHRREVLRTRQLIDGATVAPGIGILAGQREKAPSGKSGRSDHDPFPRV